MLCLEINYKFSSNSINNTGTDTNAIPLGFYVSRNCIFYLFYFCFFILLYFVKRSHYLFTNFFVHQLCTVLRRNKLVSTIKMKPET